MKFSVTPELALLLKTLRAQSDIPAKTVAERLEKSPSYVSKLENGEVKSIQRDVLARLLSIVTDEGDFFADALPAVMRALSSFMEPKRLVSQAWLLQFDVVERMVTVPAAMAEDVLAHLADRGATLEELVRFANRNQDTDLPASIPANEVVSVDYDGTPRLTVRVQLDERAVARAFAEERPLLSYLSVNCLVFAMFRLINFPEAEGKMPPDEATVVLRCTSSYMEQWNLHSLTGFSHLLSSDEFIARQEPLTRTNPRIAERIAEVLEEVAQHDALTATKQLNAFYETLRWDPAFALKLMSLPFADLGDMGFRAKRQMLEEIAAVIERYDGLSDLEKKLEEY